MKKEKACERCKEYERRLHDLEQRLAAVEARPIVPVVPIQIVPYMQPVVIPAAPVWPYTITICGTDQPSPVQIGQTGVMNS